jgi:zinc protease
MTRIAPPFALALALAGAAALAPSIANADATPSLSIGIRPRVSQTKLANGLTVVIEEDHRAPVVSMELRYAVGSRDDPKTHPGMTTLVQRMMVTATAHVPEAAYYEHLQRVGASGFAHSVAPDYSELWATVPTNAVPTVLWLWADQMGFFVPKVDQALLDKQRDAVKNERRQSVDNAPYGAVRELTRQALYPDAHPYHANAASEGLDGVTVRDVKSFFDAHYGPNDAALVIVGDVDEAATLERVKKYFDAVPPAPAPLAEATPAELKHEVRLEIAASVQETVVVMDWHTPPAFAPGSADMDAVARVLSGRRIALLHWALVDQQKIATQVTARHNVRALGSDFEIWANVARGHSAEEVAAAIDQTLDAYRANGFPAERFHHALNEAWLPRAFALEHPETRAARYADYALNRRDTSSFEWDFARYDRVTPESAQKAAQKWLDPKRRVLVFVMQDPNAPPSGVVRKDDAKEKNEDSQQPIIYPQPSRPPRPKP